MAIPILKRWIDIFFIIYCLFNLVDNICVMDFVMVIVKPGTDPLSYPIIQMSPFRGLIADLENHAKNEDEVMYAKPYWFVFQSIWDWIFFFPFYVSAVYAFLLGKEWIRMPTILYGLSMFQWSAQAAAEYLYGEIRRSNPWDGVTEQTIWMVIPLMMAIRMIPDRPFTTPIPRRIWIAMFAGLAIAFWAFGSTAAKATGMISTDHHSEL